MQKRAAAAAAAAAAASAGSGAGDLPCFLEGALHDCPGIKERRRRSIRQVDQADRSKGAPAGCRSKDATNVWMRQFLRTDGLTRFTSLAHWRSAVYTLAEESSRKISVCDAHTPSVTQYPSTAQGRKGSQTLLLLCVEEQQTHPPLQQLAHLRTHSHKYSTRSALMSCCRRAGCEAPHSAASSWAACSCMLVSAAEANCRKFESVGDMKQV
eukprot:1156081-Pelagomonas_calceolata.AAC.5